MADLNPFRVWHRFLALPNESRGKTLGVAFLVAVLSSMSISIAAHILQPRIEANRAAEQQARLDAMIGQLPKLKGILAQSGADSLQTLIVDLNTGAPTEIDPDEFDMAEAANDPATSIALDKALDIAGIGRRPDLAKIHLLKNGRDLELVILPVYATGYQSTIRALLALHGDLNSVAGLVVIEQGETPGLGANIEDPDWQALWSGKQIADEYGTLRLQVVRGKASSEFEIDGITGATRTGNAVSAMITFWIGPNGYGAVLDALRTGAL